jgi:hypothetical protein
MGKDPRTVKDPTFDFCPCCGRYSFADNYYCDECGFTYDPIDPFTHTVKSAAESHIDNWKAEMQNRIWNANSVANRLQVLDKRTEEANAIRKLLVMLSDNYKQARNEDEIKLKTFPQGDK